MHSSSATDALIGVRAGEYEITGIIGRGGMGTVYAGVHPVIGTEVAIKVIDPLLARDASLVDRFLQEARVVNKIHCSSIVDIFAFGESPDLGHYLVMPHLRGRTLADRLAVDGPLSIAEALPILRQIADALDAAHAAGVLHRDLKPDNVFLVRERAGVEKVKVLDFGIAKLTDGASVAATESGRQLGTPLFMSPEQWEGGAIDHLTDIYAFGVLVHHVLTVRYPFEASSAIRLMSMHVTARPTPPSLQGAPAFVDAVVARALDKSPPRRFPTATALCDAISVAAGHALDPVALARTMAPGLLVTPPEARRPWRLVLGLVVVAAVLAVIWIGIGRPRSAPAPAAAPTAVDAGSLDAGTVDAPPPAPLDAAPAPAPAPAPIDRSVPPRRGPRQRRPAPPPATEATPSPETKHDKEPAPRWGETVKPF